MSSHTVWPRVNIFEGSLFYKQSVIQPCISLLCACTGQLERIILPFPFPSMCISLPPPESSALLVKKGNKKSLKELYIGRSRSHSKDCFHMGGRKEEETISQTEHARIARSTKNFATRPSQDTIPDRKRSTGIATSWLMIWGALAWFQFFSRSDGDQANPKM